MYKKITIGMAVIMAGIALTTMTTSTVFATDDKEPDPNTVGEVTSEATEDYREEGNPSGFGEHASDPDDNPDTDPSDVTCGGDPGRCGLAFNRDNPESGDPEQRGSPQETIEFVCGIDRDAPGCDALEEDN